MEQLLVTVEDVQNELDLNLSAELDKQPKFVDKWLLRQQRTILNHIASCAHCGMAQVEQMLQNNENKKVIRDAILEHIDYVAANNYVEPNKVMNVGAEQTVGPVIAPLAQEMLQNAGLLCAEEGAL